MVGHRTTAASNCTTCATPCCSGGTATGSGPGCASSKARSTGRRRTPALRAVARLDGTPFPSTAKLAGRWLRGRAPALRRRRAAGGEAELASLETAYCAEVVALTYEEMGLLAEHRSPSWYDPGRFWSGDDLGLAPGFRLGGEIEVALPPAPERAEPRRSERPRRQRVLGRLSWPSGLTLT